MIVKLQKQTSAQKGEKKYTKYVVIIPNTTVKELGWEGGQDLHYNITSGRLLLIGPSSK